MAPRGNGYNNRGGWRGQRQGRGRGAFPFRGNGRGQFANRGRGGRGGQPVYRNLDVIDVDIQRYTDDSPVSGNVTPASSNRTNGNGRGRWKSKRRGPSAPLNLQVFNNENHPPPPPRREDWANVAGRGRGRGPSRGLGARYNPELPLSKLLALEKPYLRPINFVRAELTPVLFQMEEEILEVHEVQEPEDHVPTAQQVARVFSHRGAPPPPREAFFQDHGIDIFAEADSEPVVTVDFGSLGKLLDETASPLHASQPGLPSEGTTTIKATNDENSQKLQGESIFDAIKAELSVKPEQEGSKINSGISLEPPDSRLNDAVMIEISEETRVSVEQPTKIEEGTKEEEQPTFILDTFPAAEPQLQEKITYATALDVSLPLGSSLPDDDEVIVYDAPHPRSGRATPSIPVATDIPSAANNVDSNPAGKTPASVLLKVDGSSTPGSHLPISPSASNSNSTNGSALSRPFVEMSFSFDDISRIAEANRQQTASPRARRLTKRDRKARAAQRKGNRRTSFESFGAMLEERHLHEDVLERYGKRGTREGSDIDWGDENSESDAPVSGVRGDAVERVASSLGVMSIDGDLDPKAMTSFVKSMSRTGVQHISIDDIEDEERLRQEDEEGDELPSESEDSDEDSEADAIVDAEEGLLIGEDSEILAFGSESDEEDEDEDDGVSSDEEETPKRNFQARLERARQSARAKGKAKESAFSAAQPSAGDLFGERMARLHDRSKGRDQESSEEDEDDSDLFDPDFIYADEEEYLNDIQELLDDNDHLMSDRKQRKALFKAIQDGDFSVVPAKKKRDYGNDLPPELRVQWEKDRAKKAENKRKRAAARLDVAADPFAKHKGGRKSRKVMLRAARLADEGREDAPHNAVTDLGRIVSLMRTYLGNLGLTAPMVLPPMDKSTRKTVHELANAFGLRSHSKGKGTSRYTTVIKTSRSGIRVDERKVERILRTGGDWGVIRPGGARGKGRGGAPKHREGEEVGKEAPRIDDRNIGFKMLAGMGWTEGERIGVSGGLDAPLTAIIKHSKLGLGATRS